MGSTRAVRGDSAAVGEAPLPAQSRPDGSETAPPDEPYGPDTSHRSRSSFPLSVTAVLVAAGLLFTVSARTSGGESLRDEVADLPGIIQQEAQAVEATAERVSALRQEVEDLTATVADAEVGQLQARAEELEMPSGLEPVEGPGVEIVLDDAPRDRPVPGGVPADALIVHQEDVQAVVNALWAGGAEAMTLMDQRVISTSAVRCVGSTLRLQGRVYSPPYRIRAIGDTGELLAALDRSEEVQVYQEYVAAYGLGYSEQVLRSVRLPAYEGSLEMQHATVAREETA